MVIIGRLIVTLYWAQFLKIMTDRWGKLLTHYEGKYYNIDCCVQACKVTRVDTLIGTRGPSPSSKGRIITARLRDSAHYWRWQGKHII